ncbi:MAG TPA: DUF1854 domain-containing protein [Polyangiaceae bacterium]|nr:DUF1854 domain-containing protein [Polyangiaceae bacterium]
MPRDNQARSLAFTAAPADVSVWSERSGARHVAFFVERRLDGRLWVIDARGETPVDLVRCFPWAAPGRYLSLRSADGTERAFVSDVRLLDAASRAALEDALSRAAFVFDVVRVSAVDEDFELRSWSVETDRGPRRFQTPLDAWPREIAGGAWVIEDVFGDLYRVRDVARLDAKSRTILRGYTD